MTLFLDEAAVAEVITMSDALRAVREGFGGSGEDVVENLPRVLLGSGDNAVRITAASVANTGYYGVKISSRVVFGSGTGRVLNLYERDTARLCAVLQVFGLGAVRTGAVSGVATDLLARTDAETLAVIGTGRQALTQVEAMLRVRPVRTIRVFGRDRRRLAEFCDTLAGMTESTIDATIAPSSSPQEAVDGCDIVVTATSARHPVLAGEWLSHGVHINAVGANEIGRRELESSVVAKSNVIVVDEKSQARTEAADLIQPIAEGLLDWSDICGLDDLLTGRAEGRSSSDQVTLFKSLGTAIADVVLAGDVYETALRRGLGVRLPDLSGTSS